MKAESGNIVTGRDHWHAGYGRAALRSARCRSAPAGFYAKLRIPKGEGIMQWILETLTIIFVAVAAVWFVVALAYGILDGIREARHLRRKRTLPKHRPF
jgi:hypothetical protein